MSRCKHSVKSRRPFWKFRISLKEINNTAKESIPKYLSSPETSSMARFFGCALDRKPGTTIPGKPFTFTFQLDDK